ncbi:hypothetical protein BC834DRAFT_1041334 [Gloeopeniophorella convolvens]|nr:hypothetical protein BC834DRAFT_1041334 [Gloeopeniophorella convolvens]
MTAATVAPLPPYPSSHARSSLSPSQLASLEQKISRSIQQTLDLPAQTLNTPAAAAYVASYARDAAQRTLDALIWDAAPSSPAPAPALTTRAARHIHARTLLLAERLALEPSALLDLSIAYAAQPTRLRALLARGAPALLPAAPPAFAALLAPRTAPPGLHALRKAAHALLCLLRAAPPALRRACAHSTELVLALAHAYDAGLGSAARAYGALRLSSTSSAPPDDWERLFLHTKAALLDAFHLLLGALLGALAPLPDGPALAAEVPRALDVVMALRSLPESPADAAAAPPTPFFNRSLLADYQHAYDLGAVLRRAARGDPRADALADALGALDGAAPPGASRAGAFKLLLGSGVPPGVDARGASRSTSATHAGASASAPAGTASSAADLRIAEVRAVLPDFAPEYIGALLQRAEYASVERVVEALLEGTAPPPEALAPAPQDAFEYTRDRRNVFDGEEMDASRVHVGKKTDDAMAVLRDRSFAEEMKADILRRAEAPSDDEDEDADALAIFGGARKGKGRAREVAFDDELDELGAVRVAGDGEESSEGGSEDEGDEGAPGPETLVELAYIADPKVFERDAATRRSKERAALRAQTGWADEQIEGWRIMLERNPKLKERVLQKHEFAGNKPLAGPVSAGPSSRSHSRSQTPDPQAARGRGGGAPRGGRGRGRGGGRGGGDAARDRVWKDKNKARQGNHNRKRGHDKKMGRAGAPG